MKNKKIAMSARHEQGMIGGVSTILNEYYSSKEEFAKFGFEILKYDPQSKIINSIKNVKIQNIFSGLYQMKKSVKFIRKNEISIFHIHTSREFLFLKDLLLARYVVKKMKIPVVMTIHVGNINTVFHRIPHPFFKIIKRIINLYVDKLYLMSNSIKEEFVQWGIDQNKLQVLYNFSSIEKKEKPLISKNKLKLLFVGQIRYEKGVIELLDALSSLTEIDYELDICGPFMEEETKKIVLGYIANHSKVDYKGIISGKKKEMEYYLSDIIILPSYHEGLPMVILEGLSAGCAIITTHVGAIPEILSDKNACWVRKKNSEDIAFAIKQMYYDRTYLEKMKFENYMLSDKFSKTNHIQELCGSYMKMVEIKR